MKSGSSDREIVRTGAVRYGDWILVHMTGLDWWRNAKSSDIGNDVRDYPGVSREKERRRFHQGRETIDMRPLASVDWRALG